MKTFFSILLGFEVFAGMPAGGIAQPGNKGSSAEDFMEILQKGKTLFDNAYYEEASREFLIVTGSESAPYEDKIKAHYYLMKLYRAYGDNEKTASEISNILKLSPGYVLSEREPASLKELFEKIKRELMEEKEKEEPFKIAQQLNKDLVVIEQKVTTASSEQEQLNSRIKKQEEETGKLKVSFYAASITLFLLLAISAGFK